MKILLKAFLSALGFLTVLPLGKKTRITKKDFAYSTIFFPLVGAVIGIFLSLVSYLTLFFFSSFVANALITTAWIILTGALHLDGFADMVDGLFGGQTKEERLRIMRDSFIGAKGTAFLFCLLALKFALLMEIPPSHKYQALLFAPVVGRWSMVVGMFLAPYVRKEGMATAFIEHKRKEDLLWASLITLIIGVSLFKFLFLGIIIGVALGANFVLTSYLRRKIGGITGDTLGALNEIIEVFTLLVIRCFKV